MEPLYKLKSSGSFDLNFRTLFDSSPNFTLKKHPFSFHAQRKQFSQWCRCLSFLRIASHFQTVVKWIIFSALNKRISFTFIVLLLLIFDTYVNLLLSSACGKHLKASEVALSVSVKLSALHTPATKGFPFLRILLSADGSVALWDRGSDSMSSGDDVTGSNLATTTDAAQ